MKQRARRWLVSAGWLFLGGVRLVGWLLIVGPFLVLLDGNVVIENARVFIVRSLFLFALGVLIELGYERAEKWHYRDVKYWITEHHMVSRPGYAWTDRRPATPAEVEGIEGRERRPESNGAGNGV